DRMRPSRSAELYPPNGCVGCRASRSARERTPGRPTKIPLARGVANGLLPAAARHLCADSPGRETTHSTVARPRTCLDIFARTPLLPAVLHRQVARLGSCWLEPLPLRARVETMRSLLQRGRPVRTLRATIPNNPAGLAPTSRVAPGHRR